MQRKGRHGGAFWLRRRWLGVPVRDAGDLQVVAQYDRLLVRLFAVTRVVIVALAAISLALVWRSLSQPLLAAGLVAGLATENLAVTSVYLRRASLTGRLLAVADICYGLATLLLMVASLKPSANPDTDNVLYPYTVASMITVGMVFRRFLPVLAMSALAVASYLAATFWWFGIGSGVVINSMTYWAFAGISWVLAARFRDLSADLEKARGMAIMRERELARERERSRYAGELHTIRITGTLQRLQQERERARISRDLHDRVLQTLEFVARAGWIRDARVRQRVTAEAAWLRALVRDELDHPAEGLAAGLHEVIAMQADAGMHIEVNMAGLGADPLPDEAIRALCGAVTELLTNVRKHAGTTRAVLRAASASGRVVVTILDKGSGFDPLAVTRGLGLRESVMARIGHVDGSVIITSEPGAGTHVEISVPVFSGACGGPHRARAAGGEEASHAGGAARQHAAR